MISLRRALLEQDKNDVLTFNKSNFAASLFPKEKKIQLSPVDDTRDVDSVRSTIKNLKDKFSLSKVVQLGNNTFEITFQPQEDFYRVSIFLKNLANADNR